MRKLALVGYYNSARNGTLVITTSLNEFTKERPEYQKLRPLMYAARFGDTQAVTLLLAHGANINNPDGIGMTPLMIAIKMRQEAAVDVLLNAGADLKPIDSYGRAALNYATFNATPAIVKKVAAKGADLNLQSPAGMHHGETALMHAVQGGNIETLKAILTLGAKTSIRDAKGMNALNHAKKRGNKDMIALLESAL